MKKISKDCWKEDPTMVDQPEIAEETWVLRQSIEMKNYENKVVKGT